MSRIYIVGMPNSTVRLVRSNTRQQALSHVATHMFTVRVASQDDLVKAITGGTSVENYRDPAQD
jgi:hypothetical protein